MPDPTNLPQYSLAKILLIWLAVALPMPILAFWAAPKLALAWGLHPGIAIWGLMILGMVWQFVLSLLLLWPEAEAARQTGWARRLWLQLPKDPRTGTPRARLLWWLLPVIAASALLEIGGLGDGLAAALLRIAPALGLVPAPDLTGLATAEFVGAWWLIPMALVSALFNYALGEELLFRGVLLPRMHGAFGCGDWVANAVLFGAYHLIRPLTIPGIVLSTLVWTLPARRYRSIWFALVPHGIEGLFLFVLVLGVVTGAFI